MGHNVLIQGKVADDRRIVKEIEVDRSGSLITITHEHSKVHQGEFFGCSVYNDNVADDGTIDILIQTDAAKTLHSYVKLAGGGDALFELYENTTFSAAGTSITPVNHNRGSSNVCTCTFTHTPTITDVGDLLWQEYIPGGTGKGSGATPGGGGLIGAEQWVLNSGKTYLLRLINKAGSAQPLNVVMDYYSVDAH